MTPWTTTVPAFAAALVRAQHALLAAVALDHASEGRGFVAVTYRGSLPVEIPTVEMLQVGYRPRAEYVRRTATQTGAGRVLADGILQRIDRYDPAIAMVVVVTVGPQFWTTSFTLPLDAPVILAEADGVH